MTNIIGGLLVVSLMSGPVTAGCVAYEALKSQQPIVCAVKEKPGRKEKADYVRIDEMMGHIDEKNRSLKTLLKEKNKVLIKIQTVMDFRAYTKAPLNESQMNSFSAFTGAYAVQAGVLQEVLQKIDIQKDLNAAKKELLHNSCDYDVIFDDLKSLSDYQSDAIFLLNRLIESGEKTLQVL